MMSMLAVAMATKIKSSTNPLTMAMMILATSLVMASMLFKTTMSSWVAFVTILTFSSGMMTLFMYTASLSSNEKTKNKKSNKVMPLSIVMMVMAMPANKTKTMKQSMKNFSSQMMMMVVVLTLMITMLMISTHGHHPNQTMSTSF